MSCFTICFVSQAPHQPSFLFFSQPRCKAAALQDISFVTTSQFCFNVCVYVCYPENVQPEILQQEVETRNTKKVKFHLFLLCCSAPSSKLLKLVESHYTTAAQQAALVAATKCVFVCTRVDRRAGGCDILDTIQTILTLIFSELRDPYPVHRQANSSSTTTANLTWAYMRYASGFTLTTPGNNVRTICNSI